MKKYRVTILMLQCFVLLGILVFSEAAYSSTISGTVYDNRKNPLSNVDVELLDNFDRLRSRTRTEATGRYEFSGLGDGKFTVRVMPFRYDFDEQSHAVEIFTVTGVSGGNPAVQIIEDFFLVARKGSLEEVEAGVIFVQSVPSAAKKFYENALNAFGKNQTAEGVLRLKDALKIFPEYFPALMRLGAIYLSEGLYPDAAQVFMKAVEINQKSPLAAFSLGFALHKLNFNKAAIVALKKASFLSPSSAAVLFTLGTAERIEGSTADAEKHLLQAKKLSRVDNPDIHWQLALLYKENPGKYAAAAAELEAFLRSRPDAKDAENIKKLIKSLREKAASN